MPLTRRLPLAQPRLPITSSVAMPTLRLNSRMLTPPCSPVGSGGSFSARRARLLNPLDTSFEEVRGNNRAMAHGIICLQLHECSCMSAAA